MIAGLRGNKVVVKEVEEGLESGPFRGVLVPTLHHDVVERVGAVLGAGHPIAIFDFLEGRLIVHAYDGEMGI